MDYQKKYLKYKKKYLAAKKIYGGASSNDSDQSAHESDQLPGGLRSNASPEAVEQYKKNLEGIGVKINLEGIGGENK